MGEAKPWILAIVIAMIAIAGLGFSLHVLSAGPEDDTAPNFTIETIRHGNFTLSEHQGKIVVIDLMAVDCPTCRVTEQSLLQLNESRPDVQIVSVNIWTQFEDEDYLDGHMQHLGVDWPYGMDTDDLLFKYNAFEISKVAVVDAEGRLSGSAVGAIGIDRLESLVDGAEDGTGGSSLGAGLVPNLPVGLVGFALLAGVASFFAPCAFPLLPGYMAYTLSLGKPKHPMRVDPDASAAAKSGNSPDDTPDSDRAPSNAEPAPLRLREALVPGIAAASGILIIYGLFGLVVAFAGVAARPWLPLLQPGVGVLAIVLGIALLLGATMQGVIAPLQRAMDRLMMLVTRRNRPGSMTGYFSYGLGYGAAAAGCTAPVFLQLALTAFVLGWATGLQIFAVYAGTAAALMILATLIAVKARGALQKRSGQIVAVANKLSGVVLLGAGVYLIWFYHQAFGLPFVV